jgi:hypothetical protein
MFTTSVFLPYVLYYTSSTMSTVGVSGLKSRCRYIHRRSAYILLYYNTVLPPNAPSVQCGCGATLWGKEVDHGMRCPALAAQTTLRHDILKGILLRVVHQSGIASSLERTLCRLQGLEQGDGLSREGHSIRVGAGGDILLALRQVITVTDISSVHPLSINTLSAAAKAGAASSCGDQQKRNAYVRVEPNVYAFVPFSVESYGRLGNPAMKLLHDLGDEAAGPGGVSGRLLLRALFVS